MDKGGSKSVHNFVTFSSSVLKKCSIHSLHSISVMVVFLSLARWTWGAVAKKFVRSSDLEPEVRKHLINSVQIYLKIPNYLMLFKNKGWYFQTKLISQELDCSEKIMFYYFTNFSSFPPQRGPLWREVGSTLIRHKSHVTCGSHLYQGARGRPCSV